ncbi:flavin-containing monooxygenase [Saccharomonospora piscinae]|uniref:flavin-containing monooxygenase n=1 Tax=Saccharomonospora piscinae TaxID=687388 RepID=UPI000466F16F|nr:NAD(P)/FAD-dependent oxidoreductase [Saccharomonospora piscinae]
MSSERVGTLVIGGSQAGVSAGYFLKRAGADFRIVDAGNEIGQVWRSRWDSLKLYTAAKHNNLPGMPFPGDPDHVPGKSEMADYLVEYVRRFDLPLELEAEVEALTRTDGTYVATLGTREIVADHVVVATGPTGQPRTPHLAHELDPSITQLNAAEYRNPEQLAEGPALVVGAGNSGAEIAIELAGAAEGTHPVWLAGRDVGTLPVTLAGIPYRILNKLLTTDTKAGRKMAASSAGKGTPLVRLKPEDITEAGVRRTGPVESTAAGKPAVSDGSVLDPASVVWCTGYVRDYGWIKLPVFDESGEPVHHRGVVTGEPGLYFLGLPFLHSFASSLIMGVTKDAEYVVEQITGRSRR